MSEERVCIYLPSIIALFEGENKMSEIIKGFKAFNPDWTCRKEITGIDVDAD